MQREDEKPFPVGKRGKPWARQIDWMCIDTIIGNGLKERKRYAFVLISKTKEIIYFGIIRYLSGGKHKNGFDCFRSTKIGGKSLYICLIYHVRRVNQNLFAHQDISPRGPWSKKRENLLRGGKTRSLDYLSNLFIPRGMNWPFISAGLL